jgi:selenide, water dikinase
MKMPATPILKDVVLVGAGHAHVGVMRRFGMAPVPGVRFTLITRQVDTPYSGMLPGMIAGLYQRDDVHIDTGPLARFAGARLYHSEVTGLDLASKRVLCNNRPPVPYDVLSLNIGSTPSAQDVPGVTERAIPVKPIDSFLARFDAARARILAAGGRARIGVVGAGAGGVELILALHHRLTRDLQAAGHDPKLASFALFTSSAELLPSLPAKVRKRFAEVMAERGIALHTSSRVTAVGDDGVAVTGGAAVPLDEIFWTTRAAAAPWLADTGLALNAQGFVRVGLTLQSVSHPEVFAAGDVAAIDGHDVPRSGVYAVRSGPPLATNIRRLIAGGELIRHRPQRDALYLISTGGPHAIGTRNGVMFEGDWAWRLKDWIDRRFMDKFNALPEMAQPEVTAISGIADKQALKDISAIAMRCGGCGAKVGATVLSRALCSLVPLPRADVIVGLDAPDDAAVVDVAGPKLAVHSVDYFRAIVDDPYIFGKIAATHALGDIFAMGAEAQTALAIATVPYGIESKVEADLSAMMIGANEVLREANCALVGGHTSEGAELALGFSVNGLIARASISRKGNLVPGDVLIVTKPIGTGTLLAADMRGKARARWVTAALDHMTHSNRIGAEILRAHGVHAATDVTGFGLLGHLVEMVRASGVDATLDLPTIPLLDGVRETMVMGIYSSLQPQNVRLRRAIRNLAEAGADPLYPALFDPQTAGGLLASVPEARATACIVDLRAAGYTHAAVIGKVNARSQELEPIVIRLAALNGALSNAEAGQSKADAATSEGTRQDAHEPVL